MPLRNLVVRAVACAALLAATAAAPFAFPAQAADGPDAFTLNDPRIVESSGLAASQRHDGVYWTHNDSEGAAEIYAVDSATGDTVATVTLEGVTARDIEAISLGPEGDLYVGDIGDNFGGEWPEVWIYRLPEPETLADATLTPTVYALTYEDGPRDAEALMVHPVTGRVWIASKLEDGGAALYEGPPELSDTGLNTFARGADVDLWVTDGAFSPDGTRLLLRGYASAQMYRWNEGAEGGEGGGGGEPEALQRRVIPPFQLQGESVTFAPDGRTLMFGEEGAGSTVQPVALGGELLPDSVASDQEEGSGETADAEGEGAEGSAAAGDDGDDGGDSTLSLQAGTVVIVAVLLFLAFRYLRRGRPD